MEPVDGILTRAFLASVPTEYKPNLPQHMDRVILTEVFGTYTNVMCETGA